MHTTKNLPSVYTFLHHIGQYLSQYQLNLSLFRDGMQLPFTLWFERWFSILDSFDDESLLV